MISYAKAMALAGLDVISREECVVIERQIDDVLVVSPDTREIVVNCSESVAEALRDIYREGGWSVSWASSAKWVDTIRICNGN